MLSDGSQRLLIDNTLYTIIYNSYVTGHVDTFMQDNRHCVKNMKKYILSPLCSAVIIPGLGQILNNQIKKGLIMLGIVFLLFIAGTIKLALVINSLMEEVTIDRLGSTAVLENLYAEDLSVLWLILIAFGIVWVYSVLDAFRQGRKIDSNTDKDSP